ncbi:MAG: hypothetical protein HY735_08255 [Verrucomicrobia bacterium]|nr:hypothetical protein [Verrucomicrobiota bacterium]
MRRSIPFFAIGLLLLTACCGLASSPSVTVLDLNKLPFFLGREYFVLRSARAQMIVQADRADLGPGLTWMLFDVQDARQSVRKEGAFNFIPGEGFGHSALVVKLGQFPFTALGHRTETRWTISDGIPAVEAVWWAGGIRVTERLSAWANAGAFRRSIRLEGAHLVGPETVSLRLELPPGECERVGGILLQNGRGARLALGVLGRESSSFRSLNFSHRSAEAPLTPSLSPLRGEGVRRTGEGSHRGDVRVSGSENSHASNPSQSCGIEIGPVSVLPGQAVSLETVLVVQIPAGDQKSLLEQAEGLVRSGATAETAATRDEWSASSVVITGDQTVQGIFDKARFGLPGMIADDGTMDAGIFEYGAQWVRDTSCTVLGALHAGHIEITRAALQRVLTKMINREGATMIANAFEKPDLEQFDQMGELLHVLRAWRDWTGDDSLIREHRELLLALIERPLRPEFRDETGMVHNRREFWERTFTDAYELAYQTYVILGLREAAELAPSLGAVDRAERWRAEADKMLRAVLSHPTRSLTDQGRLIKRRKVTGQIADQPDGFKGFQPDVPLNTEQHHLLLPDASMALPIALGVVDPRSELARRTLDDLEQLWNTRWSDGGYDRYHTSTQPDQPGPWPFATTFILRAQHDAGLYDRSRRSLEWLDTCQGGRAGFWLEEIPSVRSLSKSCGLVCWTSGEIALFVVRHYLGVRFGERGQVRIRPALYPGSPPVKADLRFRQSRLRLEIDGSGPVKVALLNGQAAELSRAGEVCLPLDFAGGTVVIRCAER